MAEEWQGILRFWFEESAPEQWFKKDEAFDAEVKRRFEGAYRRAARGELAEWRQTPQGRLAEVLVLDQFGRNIYRGTPEAFAADALALKLAEEAVEAGDDKKLEPAQRRFLYMPFMHSESPAAHAEALRLFEALGDKEVLAYEHKHKAIIDRFGRYPHRNKILGRLSTPEEEEFLKENPGF